MTAVLGADRNLPTPPLIAQDADQEGDSPLPSLTLLLAEDNEINQRFAVRLLEKAGHRVTVAADGQQAVAAVQGGRFDAVLMDVQMPVLDGFSATQEIRRWEAHLGSHVPVIAMTANASEGDREKCLAAGMDGYVAKPIKSALLFSELRRLLPEQKTSPEPSVTSATTSGPVEETAATATNSWCFDAQSLLAQNDGNIEFLREIRELLAEDGPALLRQVEVARAGGDFEKVARSAHTLKGMVGNFQAESAQSAALELESSAQSGDPERIRVAQGQMERELTRLNDDLARFLSEVSRPAM